MVLLIILATVSLLLFRWLWYQKWDIWYILNEKSPIDFEFLPEPDEDFFQILTDEALKYNIPESEEDKEAVEAMEPFLDLADDYTAIYVYGLEDGMYRTGKGAYALSEEGKYQDFFRIGYNWTEGAIEQPFNFVLEFKNGYATVIINFYHSTFFIFPYFIFCLAVCAFLFLFVMLYFVGRKMRVIERLKGEILEMASGNLDTPVKSAGQDELGVLARELDGLRITLNEKFTSEQELRKSNQELIAALSHDLRTPLTILKGYLEILQLGRNQEKQGEYIERCIRKTEDIQEMTNRMFDYALVYDEVDYEKNNLNLERIPLGIILADLKEHGEFLELAGFQIKMTPEDWPSERGNSHGTPDFAESKNTPYEFQADPVLLKRVFSNLFSNVIKYADKKVPVQIEILAGAELRIIIRNHIKARQGQVESSCIGLKSVEKIMKLMDGDMEVKEEEGKFTVELCLI